MVSMLLPAHLRCSGPKGIWTLKRKKQEIQQDGLVPFEFAKPSFTHQARTRVVACAKHKHKIAWCSCMQQQRL